MKRLETWMLTLLPMVAACSTDGASDAGRDDTAAEMSDTAPDAGSERDPSEDLTDDPTDDEFEPEQDTDAEETDGAEFDDSTDGTDSPSDPEAAPPDDRNFEALGTNPYVFAEHDPLSTFAADVDTASYDLFRKDIGLGRLPPPASVRLEEFVNYFRYAYPVPENDADEPFRISLAAAPNLIDNGTTLFRVGIQGEVLAEDGRKPMNLVFLVDTSGSMQSADKLPLVQRLLVDTLDLLAPDDTISIVTYAGSSGLALPATPASSVTEIKRTIYSFEASGSTAGAQGIQLAYEQASENFLEGGVNHVVLCTDGDFNVGISDTDELVEFIEDQRRSGVTFTALGFGSDNLNDAAMEAMSNAGNGTYAVISDQQHAHDYVTDRLFSSLQFIAKDMKLQVEFNADRVLAYRLLGYENRALADDDFRNDVVDAGEIGSGHRVTALYELVMLDGAVPMPEGAEMPIDGDAYSGPVEVAAEDIALVKVRYKDVDATALDEAHEVSLGLPHSDVAASRGDLDDDFEWAMAVASFSEVLKQSPYVDESLMPEIEHVVEAQANRDDDRAQFVELFHQARELMGVAEAGDPPTPPVAVDAGLPGDAGLGMGSGSADAGSADAGSADAGSADAGSADAG